MGGKEHINKNGNLTAAERPQKKRRRNEQNNEYIGIIKGELRAEDTKSFIFIRKDFKCSESRMTGGKCTKRITFCLKL